MATLFEIDQAILACIDEETGEIIDLERLNELQIERNTKIKKVAQWYRNLTDDAKAFKENADYFMEKKKGAERKAESLKKWLEAALDGARFEADDKTVSVSYRRSEAVEVEDELAFIAYAQENNLDDLLTYKDPTINKTAIKQALKDGRIVNGANLVERQNIQIK